MSDHVGLNEAMQAGDELAEAELRYSLLAEAFTEMPQLRANLNSSLERAKAEILRLRAAAREKAGGVPALRVVPFDASRFETSKTARTGALETREVSHGV